MATFLLVSFAVAVGVVVMNFGRAQVEEAAECSLNTDLKLAQIGGTEQLCYDATAQKLLFTVENGVNIKVEGLVVNIIGTNKAETMELNDAVMVLAGTYVGTINYDSSVNGAIRQVKITPKVTLYEQELFCPEQSVVVEKVKEC